MEVGRDGVADAVECRRRCLDAMDGCTKIEDKVACWRMASAYSALARKKRATGGDVAAPAALTSAILGMG